MSGGPEPLGEEGVERGSGGREVVVAGGGGISPGAVVEAEAVFETEETFPDPSYADML